MSGKLILLVSFGAILLFCSCGASKKLESAQAQIADLETKNSQLTASLNDAKKQAVDASSQIKTISDQFNSYKKECQANEQDLNDVIAIREEFIENMIKLEEKLEDASAEFQNKGLDVYSKDGVVFVDLQDNLLYKSGSAALSADGKKVLGNLASVLNEYPKLKVIVVGYTDTMHVKGVKDNWSLSTERANGVVRILSKDYNIDPSRLTAAGKGKFSPIADNRTAEGRAKNRRTEIVLNPDWERIWDSVKKE